MAEEEKCEGGSGKGRTEGVATPTVVTETMLEDILGVSQLDESARGAIPMCLPLQPRKFEHELSERLTRPGVAVGEGERERRMFATSPSFLVLSPSCFSSLPPFPLSVCLSVCLSACLPVCLSACLPVPLSSWPPSPHLRLGLDCHGRRNHVH